MAHSRKTRAEAARENGAKSQGPISPEGKIRSSQNALKHGHTSRLVVLHHESHDLYNAFEQRYLDFYLPTDLFEFDKITDIIQCRWRLRRLLGEETDLRDFQRFEIEPALREKVDIIDNSTVQALAFHHLTNAAKALPDLHRYEAQHRRTIRLAENDLFSYRAAKAAGLPYIPSKPARKQKLRNEPQTLPPPPPDPLPQPIPTPPPNETTAEKSQNEPNTSRPPIWKRFPFLLLAFIALLLSPSHTPRTVTKTRIPAPPLSKESPGSVLPRGEAFPPPPTQMHTSERRDS